MAEGILGLGSSALNQELFDKLKEADRAARVQPIEDRLSTITEEGGETDTLKAITEQVNQFLESVKPFDLFVKGGVNAFNQKVANVTGTSAVFDAVNVGKISEGTTEVFIEQLAKKDVYQSSSFSDKEATIPASSSIDINGKTFTTQGEDFESLAQAINDEGTMTATYDSGANTLTINDNAGSNDVVFSTTGKSYSDLSTDINADVNFSSSIPSSPLSGDMITLSQPSKPVYQSDIMVSSTDIVDADGGTITVTVDGVDKEFTVGTETTYNDLIEEINLDEELDAKLTSEGRLSISHSDKKTEITVTESLTTETLGMSLGEKFSTANISYEDLAKKINNNSSYNVNIEKVGVDSNRLVIKSTESGLENAISITQTGVDLGLNKSANHTVQAQNLKATVDGIDYDVSSNVIVADGGLKITAVEKNEPGEFSAISIEKDVSTVEPMIQEFVTQYNNLISTIDGELYSSESKIEDKSTLRTIVEGIKDKLFGSYGEDDDLSIFNFGLEVDKSGVLSLDSEKFNEALEDNIDSLKDLFIGAAEKPGLGTQLKEYVDSLDSFDGLLTKYEENMNSRKESLEEEVEEAQESLDSRYAILSQQFASYGAVIAQFENQFSGLKMMIEQSTSGN